MNDEYIVVSEYGMEHSTPMPKPHAKAKAYSLNKAGRRRNARAIPVSE